jgi:hypothetical protein
MFPLPVADTAGSVDGRQDAGPSSSDRRTGAE